MENNLLRAKSVDITSYLSSIGIQPVREHSRSAYYLSPFRSENNPSFCVNKIKNRWADYGEEGKFGDVLDLVCFLDSCTVFEAANKILGEEQISYHRPEPIVKEDNIEIVSVQDKIDNETLINYLEGTRRIPLQVAQEYCKQVLFRFPTSAYASHYGIAVENDKGGFVIRSTWFQGTTRPAGITTSHFSNGLEVLIFEGFMDMLSYVVLYGKPGHTCITLNSLVYIPMIMDILHGYDIVHLWIDNDPAADGYAEQLMDAKISIVDHRADFAGYNDLNEFLQVTGGM
jgi:hypothetical protein